MKRLFVIYRTELVGELTITKEQRYQFQYTDSWLNNPEAFALSCSLPLQADAYSQPLSYAYFSNLIPEGDLRHKIANVLGISEKNDFALLETIGGEVAGAIRLLGTLPNANDTSPQLQRDLSENQLAKIIKQLDARPFLVAEEGLRLSLAGAQNKLPVIYQNKRFALPLAQTASTHILKPEPDRRGNAELVRSCQSIYES